MKIWNISIKQPVFMSMLLLAGIVMGIVSYTRMPVDLYPDIEFPVVVVNTVYPGASPEEVEDQVTSVLEEHLVTISGLEEIDSTSAESISTIILRFELDLSVDQVSQDVREKVDLLRNQMPSDIHEPVIQTFDPNDMPILTFSVADTSGQYTLLELREFVEDDIQSRIERISNVSAVEVSGGHVREIQVDLDTTAMQALRITPQQVTGALQAANVNVPGGSVEDGGIEYLVRTPANLQTVQDIENVIISERASPIYLRDIANVTDGFEEQDSITRLNGEEAIVLNVRKQSSSNTVTVADDVNVELNAIRSENPNLDIAVTSDQSIRVKEATGGAVDDLLYAVILASIVMFIFFKDIRNTLVTIAGLPVILISTLFFMSLFDISLNQISLLALALVVGLVIDDGIVVRENILRWVEKGYSPRVAASLGTAEVAMPVIAISVTILAVFLPIAFAQGIIGKFFLDFGLTVSIAVTLSIFEAMTMAPMLSAYFFKKDKKAVIDVEDLSELDNLDEKNYAIDDEIEEASEKQGRLSRGYGSFLDWTLRHKLVAGLSAIIIIAVSFYSVTLIQFSFLPEMEATEFTITMSMPGGTPQHLTAVEAITVENILREHPATSDVVTIIGKRGAPEEATFTVALKDDLSKEVTVDTVMEDLRQPLADVPGVIMNTAGNELIGADTDITIEVIGLQGVDYNELGSQAEYVAEQIAALPDLTDIDVSYKSGRPEMQLNIDRQRSSDLGLSPAQIASTVRLLLNGDVATTFRGEGADADIRVQLAEEDRASAQDILNINLMAMSGQLVPLRSVAEMDVATSPNAISRSDRLPTIIVSANVANDRSVPLVSQEVAELLEGLEMSQGTELRLGGTADDLKDARSSLLLAFGLAVIFIYMVLASQFGSFIQPFIIMLAMPLAIVGAILALLLTGKPLDMTAMIGFIMLMGLVVKNSVLLVDFANRARRKGASADDAMRIAGPIRLRPILMTALSMILAMIPIAVGMNEGGEFRQPMAIAILGGMITSTLLTLLIVPLSYGAVIGFQDRLFARRRARRAEKEQRVADKQGRLSPSPLTNRDATLPVSD